jgi:hypothetical protein
MAIPEVPGTILRNGLHQLLQLEEVWIKKEMEVRYTLGLS